MNSDLFIPPPSIRTRILGTYARRALYSNKRDAKALSHVDLTTPYDDQYWYIRPGKDQYAGQYLIVSAFTDQCLYINTRDYAWGDVGTFAPIGAYGDQYFDLVQQQGQGVRAGQFRIHTPSVNAVLFSRTHAQPELGCIPGNQTFDDHFFTFELEPLDFVGVEFDLSNAVVMSTRPKNLFSQQLRNQTGTDQDQSVKISESTEQQSTFEAEVGLELGVSTQVSCGVPMLAEGKVEVSAKVHSNLKWGSTNVRSQSWEATVNLKVPGGKTIRVTATVTESILNVPFVSTWKSKKTGQTMTTKGIFKGISSSDLSTNFFLIEK
ncbi:hypothetical protein BS50DRAFT_578688 [Corynespora cassiicola Philippines]|uniref:Uncharacterized protein n=1 Tax=Corynespora cassiicola Philippines TaxID=1448308 RepID=A0A2T2N7B3_CORCC|nr:hypothetical protein BS50DRAFT_578688 [Corynespora cassiicola Philippines]